MGVPSRKQGENHLKLVVDNESPQAPKAAEILRSSVLVSLKALQKPGAPDSVKGLVSRFLETTPELHRKIAQALESGNASAALAMVQFAKGSAHYLGGIELAALLNRMEELVEGQHLKSAALMLIEVEEAYGRLAKLLKNRN